MLANLPRSYDNLVMQLYQLDDKNFTSLNIQKSLLAEYDRVTVREKFEARPKEPAVFSIESAVSRKKNSTKEFKERRKCFFLCGTVGHIRKNCWKFKNANKVPTHQQRKPPTFKQDGLSNPAVFYASAYCTQSMDIEFVIDSAATEHFVNDINLFTNFQKFSSSASMAEGTTNILGKGDVNLEIVDNSDDNEPNAIETQSDDFSTDIEDISDSEAHLVDIKIPNNFKEYQMVPERENWCNAMKEELEILKAQDVYEIVPRPKNKNVLGNKWVYTLKKDVTGKIKRYRARLVAQGFK
ncbi:hypothetical protein AVEN_188790-1 [Araneus ventricosus]|uniref:Reverse transcriptase Ty1/copia-type domain-containing protein n=1 Tax=Araneus ventricosus TaxID=182803 RepID=A0A4Y2IEL1_ARAVE|nr:hypothetical protein AVEN_188790-1 [Araneus ventricosus]